MKKTLIAASIMLCTTSAMAHNCDVNVEGEISLIDNVLTVVTDDNDVIKIDAGHALNVNGDQINLNDQQSQWVASYYNGVNAAIPAVAEIALDGVAIASTAVTEGLGQLLGSDNEAIENLTIKLDQIRTKIHHNFYAADGSIRLNRTDFSDESMMGEQWESELEDAIEDVVSSSIGHLMIAMGSQMLFGDDEDGDFGQKIEDFADNIEHRMEQQAESLEDKADALCQQMVSIDYAENNLQESISELSDLNVINVRNHHNQM